MAKRKMANSTLTSWWVFNGPWNLSFVQFFDKLSQNMIIRTSTLILAPISSLSDPKVWNLESHQVENVPCSAACSAWECNVTNQYRIVVEDEVPSMGSQRSSCTNLQRGACLLYAWPNGPQKCLYHVPLQIVVRYPPKFKKKQGLLVPA